MLFFWHVVAIFDFISSGRLGRNPFDSCSTTHANHCSACTIAIKRLHGRLTQTKKLANKICQYKQRRPSLFIPPMNMGKLHGIKVLWLRSLRSMVRSFHFIVRLFHSFSIKLDEIKCACFGVLAFCLKEREVCT